MSAFDGWMFKILLRTYPFALLWVIWVTVNIFDYQGFKNHGERFTKAQAIIEHQNILNHVEDHYVHKTDKNASE